MPTEALHLDSFSTPNAHRRDMRAAAFSTRTVMKKLLRLLALPALTALVVAGAMPAQDPRLAEAQLLEEQAFDLKRAEAALRAIVDDETATVDLRNVARIRLGALLVRLQRVADAQTVLAPVLTDGRAKAILEGAAQDPAASSLDLARTLVQRATALLADNQNNGNSSQLSEVAEDIRWLRADGARALVEALRFLREKSATRYAWLASLLLKIGTTPALEYLQEVAREVDPAGRSLVLMAADGAPAADVLPVLVQFALAPDPEGAVARRLAGTGCLGSFTAEHVLELSRSTAVGARTLALQWMLQRPTALNGTPLVGFLRAALDDANPAVARTAHRVLTNCMALGKSWQLLAIERIPRGMAFPNPVPRIEMDDEVLGALVAAAAALDPARWEDPACKEVTRLLAASNHAWRFGTVGCDHLLALAAQGWFRAPAEDTAVPPLGAPPPAFLAACTPQQFLAAAGRNMPHLFVVELLSALPGTERARAFSFTSAQLQQLFDGLRAASVGGGWGMGFIGSDDKPTVLLQRLLSVVGAVGDSACVPWLMAYVREEPKALIPVVLCLRDILDEEHRRGRSVSAPAEALVALLADRGAAGSLTQWFRTCTVLARVGDMRCVDLLLQRREEPVKDGGPDWISFLQEFMRHDPALAASERRAQVAAAWRALLAGARTPVLSTLASWAHSGRLQQLPGVARIPLLEVAAGDDGLPTALVELLFVSVTAADLADDTGLRPALARALASPTFLELLPRNRAAPPWLAEFAPVLRNHILDPDFAQTSLMWLDQLGIAPTAVELERMVAEPRLRSTALEFVRDARDPAVRKLLLGLLVDPDPQVRVDTVATIEHHVPMELLVEEGFVDALLLRLRDTDPGVRNSVGALLDRMRAYQEQRAFWDRFQRGVVIGPEATLARLLEQARRGQRDELRLLAIDALGILGNPDALPYLVDWSTQDEPNPDVRARATAAIKRIGEAPRQPR